MMKDGAMQHQSLSALGRQLLQREEASPDPGIQQAREGNQCLDAYRGRKRQKELEFTFASLPLIVQFLSALLLYTCSSSGAPGHCPWWEASATSSCVPSPTMWHDSHLSDHPFTELLLE